eukprot:jgi/Bigna1/143634/aug1.80_g18342
MQTPITAGISSANFRLAPTIVIVSEGLTGRRKRKMGGGRVPQRRKGNMRMVAALAAAALCSVLTTIPLKVRLNQADRIREGGLIPLEMPWNLSQPAPFRTTIGAAIMED